MRGGHRRECRRLAERQNAKLKGGESRVLDTWIASTKKSFAEDRSQGHLPDSDERRIPKAMEEASKSSSNKVVILKRCYGCQPYEERAVIGDLESGLNWLLDDGRWIPKADQGVNWDWLDPARRKQRSAEIEQHRKGIESKNRNDTSASFSPASDALTHVAKGLVTQIQKHHDRVARQRNRLVQALTLNDKSIVRQDGGLLAFVIQGEKSCHRLRAKFLEENDKRTRAKERKRRLSHNFRGVVWALVFVYDVRGRALQRQMEKYATWKGDDKVNYNKKRVVDDTTPKVGEASSTVGGPSDKKKPHSATQQNRRRNAVTTMHIHGESQAGHVLTRSRVRADAASLRIAAVAKAEEIMRERGEMELLEELRAEASKGSLDALDQIKAEKLEAKFAAEVELAETRLRQNAKERLERERYENYKRMMHERDLEVLQYLEQIHARIHRVTWPFRRAAKSMKTIRAWALRRYRHSLSSALEIRGMAAR